MARTDGSIEIIVRGTVAAASARTHTQPIFIIILRVALDRIPPVRRAACIHSFLRGINTPGLHAPMKLIDYARSPLHRRADTRSFCTRRWKGSRWDAFASERPIFCLLLPTNNSSLASDARAIPFLFSTLVFDVQCTAARTSLPSFYITHLLATLLRSPSRSVAHLALFVRLECCQANVWDVSSVWMFPLRQN